MEACINPKITCCGFQLVSLSATHARHAAVVCARPELRGSFLGADAYEEKDGRYMTDCHAEGEQEGMNTAALISA